MPSVILMNVAQPSVIHMNDVQLGVILIDLVQSKVTLLITIYLSLCHYTDCYVVLSIILPNIMCVYISLVFFF